MRGSSATIVFLVAYLMVTVLGHPFAHHPARQISNTTLPLVDTPAGDVDLPVKNFGGDLRPGSGPLYGPDGPKRDDVQQGLGNQCFLAATLGMMAWRKPEKIVEMINTLGVDSNNVGTVQVESAGTGREKIRLRRAVVGPGAGNSGWIYDYPEETADRAPWWVGALEAAFSQITGYPLGAVRDPDDTTKTLPNSEDGGRIDAALLALFFGRRGLSTMSTEGYGDKYVQSNQIREREDISKIIETDGNSPDHVVLIGTIPLTPSELKDHNFVNNDLLNGASGPTKTKPNHRFFVRNHVYGVLGVTCNIRGDIMVKLWNPWGLKKDLKLQEILPHIRSAVSTNPNTLSRHRGPRRRQFEDAIRDPVNTLGQCQRSSSSSSSSTSTTSSDASNSSPPTPTPTLTQPVPVPNPTFGPGPLPIFPLVLPGCLLPPPACLIVACGLGVCPDVPYPEGMIAAGCILPAPACNISCEDEEQKKCYADEEYATANVSSTVPLSTFVEASTTPIAATEEPMTTPTEAPAVPSTQPSAVPDNGNGDDDNGGVIPVLPPPGDDLDVPNTGMGNGETTQTTSATGPASTDALTTNPTVPSSATEAAVATAAMETPTTVSAFETLVTASAMETPVTSSPLEEPGSISPMEVPSTITDPSAPDDELQPFKTFTFSDAPEPTDSPSNTSDPAVSDNAPAPNISSDSSTILASVDSTGTNEATETDTFPSSITATMSGDEEGDMSATSSSTARADPSENAVASAASDLVPINTLGTPRNGTISSITISTSNQVGPALAGNDSESATSSAGNIFVEPVSSGSRNTSIASATSSSTRPVVSSAATGATTSSSAALDSSTTSTGAVTSGAPTSNSGIPEASTTSTGASPSKSHRQCVRKADKRRIA